MRGSQGYSLIELLIAFSCLAIIAAMSVPGLSAALDSSRTHGAARYLAARMMVARAYATSHGTTAALRFETVEGRVTVGVFADGNRNGVRTIDIAAGVDHTVTPPVAFEDLFPGVTLTLSEEASALFSFTSVGTASTGTVEVHGPRGARFAVRVAGVTARTRILRYVATSDMWSDAW